MRLWKANGLRVALAESLETTQSFASGLLSRLAETWVALSTSDMAGLRLPPGPIA